jgi:succinate dehydrogenase flavin-adding protein (antitoxin of CptAB toxin-antitoxin module)
MLIEVTNRIDVRLRRLMFRSWHRGTQESDLILGSFAEAYLPAFESADDPSLTLAASQSPIAFCP